MTKVVVFSQDRQLKDQLKSIFQVPKYSFDELREKDLVLDYLSNEYFNYIILDARAVGGDMDLVSILREMGMQKILWLTPEETIGSAADAIRRGSDFYLTLPLKEQFLKQVIGEWETQEQAPQAALAPLAENIEFEEAKFVGRSEKIKHVFLLAARIAPSDSTILITGETGVGKELVARTIHRLSDRSKKPFVAINCGAIPENLLESELFGFKKGAFTGANQDRPGLFQQANGGVFFLDEIGELSPTMQVKLLRVLDENKIRPLGTSEEIPVNVRILAATNRDLVEEVAANRFRMDLLYRLNVVNIIIPPLRERPEDIPPLVKFFLEKYNNRFKKNVISITRDALFGMMQYDYPGNVRELENIIQHGILLSDGNVITKTSLPPRVFQRAQLAIEGSKKDQSVSMDKAEEELIKQALVRFDGNQTSTAKSLGISRSTLWRKIKAYKLENFK